MKREAQYLEGPQAWQRFEKAMRAVVRVPHEDIQRKIEEHRKEAARNPHKRGPKPKRARNG